MSNVYDITNHVDYQRHMTDFISKERVRGLLKKYVTQIEEQEVQITQLKNLIGKQNAALAKCPKPDPCAKCKVDIKNHPEYKRVLGLLDKLSKKPEECTNSDIEKAKANLIKLQKRCGADCPKVEKPKEKECPKCPKCEQKECPEPKPCPPCPPQKPLPPIEQHPDFERLIRELNKKHNGKPADIRLHPDYAYFKGYYEDKIAKLEDSVRKHKAKAAKVKGKKCKPCKKHECPKCPECPECPPQKQCPKQKKCPPQKECPPAPACPKCPKTVAMTAKPNPVQAEVPAFHQYNKAPEGGPRPFRQSRISQLNPTAKIPGQPLYRYDPVSF